MDKAKYDSFQGHHPLVNFTYFALVLWFSMFIAHPLAQIISLFAAAAYAIECEGIKSLLFSLKLCLPIILLTVFINPAFNHAGTTRLMYLPTGNPLTLESVLFGLSAGLMMAAVLLWFVNFNRVITSDKFVYLFGKILPILSLLLSMTLRFVPKFTARLKIVVDAQRGIGRENFGAGLLRNIRAAATVLSITVTWALEDAIQTADSMKSRGYGLKNRTAFSIYRFDERDKMMLLWIGFCGVYLMAGSMANAFAFRFFPSIRYVGITPLNLSFYLVYLLLLFTPTILNRMEKQKWRAIHSKM